jgi:ABC-2 type transport system permease protein
MHAFAAVAFWVRDARSTWFLYQKLVFVLGGMLLPLEVLPDGLAAVARWLPFLTMAYAPARLASGHVEPYLLAVQAGWLVVLALAAARVFALGERRLQVVGG